MMLPSAFPYATFAQANLSSEDMRTIRAWECAQRCVEHSQWDFLGDMIRMGFDINTAPMHELVEETLLYRAIRVHIYEELADKIDHLLAMGADPHKANGQQITPLGQLCIKSRDMPNHRFIAAFEALERGGVSILDRCAFRTKEGMARYLVDDEDAMGLLGKYCPELLPWAQSRSHAALLQAEIPAAPGGPSRRRL